MNDTPSPIENNMPPDWRQIEELLYDLNTKWKLYKDLFLKEEHVPIFNDVGTNMWITLQPILFESVIASIARFFDPAKMRHRETSKRCVSLEGIKQMPEFHRYDQELGLSMKIRRMRALYEPSMKEWRNNRLSHNNWDTATNKATLPEIAFKHVDEIIELISEFANALLFKINKHEAGYCPLTSHWVEDVMEVIRKGLAARQLEWDKLERGEFS